ncbi:MAG: DinB family protein [Chloroflexota bacterium]
MRALTTNQQLITELEHSRAELLNAIRGLSEEQMSRPAINGWSVKDHLAHLTVWDEMRFFEISRIARGGEASFKETPDEEGLAWINEPTVAMRRDLSLAQVLADLSFARDLVLQAVALCPEERLDQSLYEEIGIEGGAAHDRSHAKTIADWRTKECI